MWCLRCGNREPGPENFCNECGNELGPVENRVGYFNQMLKLTGELLTNQITIEEYENTIQWATEATHDMLINLEPIEKQMKTAGFNELALTIMSRPIQTYKQGVKTFQEGLEKLRHYVYEQKQSHLHTGLSLLEKANNMFNNTADTTNYMIDDISRTLEEIEAEQS